MKLAVSPLGSPEVLIEEDLAPAYDRGQDPPHEGGDLVITERLFDTHLGVEAARTLLRGRAAITELR
jgi:hypothetical protein